MMWSDCLSCLEDSGGGPFSQIFFFAWIWVFSHDARRASSDGPIAVGPAKVGVPKHLGFLRCCLLQICWGLCLRTSSTVTRVLSVLEAPLGKARQAKNVMPDPGCRGRSREHPTSDRQGAASRTFAFSPSPTAATHRPPAHGQRGAGLRGGRAACVLLA